MGQTLLFQNRTLNKSEKNPCLSRAYDSMRYVSIYDGDKDDDLSVCVLYVIEKDLQMIKKQVGQKNTKCQGTKFYIR